METVGIKVNVQGLNGNDTDAVRLSGSWDWQIFRNGSDLITVVQNTTQLAPVGPQTMRTHFANEAGELDLMPFEEELNTIINGFIGTRDPAERTELMRQYQQVYHSNVYGVGLTAYPGALIINKRFANIPSGAPIFMYKGPRTTSSGNVCSPRRMRSPVTKSIRHAARCAGYAWRHHRRLTCSPVRGRRRSAPGTSAAGPVPHCPAAFSAPLRQRPPMLRFIAIRLLQAIPVLFVMSVITFIIIQLPPGDYGDYIAT